MELSEFEIGQRVWVRLIGNAARNKSEDELIEEWKVTSVGKKYLYARKIGKNDLYTKIFIKPESKQLQNVLVESTKSHIQNYLLYKSKEDILEEEETRKLRATVESFFMKNISDLTREQLEKIMEIIKESGDNNGLE